MKIVTLLVLSYTLYLNNEQTNYLRNATQLNLSKEFAKSLLF